MECGLPVHPLDRWPGVEGLLTLIMYINWADLPSIKGPGKRHEVKFIHFFYIKEPVVTSFLLIVNGHTQAQTVVKTEAGFCYASGVSLVSNNYTVDRL